MRWVLIVLAGLPALISAGGAVEGSVAVRPYFADSIGRLPVGQLARLLGELGGSVGGLIGLAVLLAVVGQQVLTAGALAWIDRDAERGGRGGVFRSVLNDGAPWIWGMLRVVLLAALLAVVGIGILNGLFDRISDHGHAASWTGWTLIVLLPGLQVMLTLVWLLGVGAFAMWCRVVMLADGRRRVRSAALIAWRVCWRCPFAAPARYVVVMGGATLLGAAVLIVWRQLPPADLLIARMWALAWLLALLVQAAAWYHVLLSARRMYAGWLFDDLRARPGEPERGGWLRRLRRREPEKPATTAIPLSPDPALEPRSEGDADPPAGGPDASRA
jgi:hypothetical protein